MTRPGRPATQPDSLAAPTRNLTGLFACITILAIAGTLSGCGRYGSPIRVSPIAVEESDANREANRPVSDAGITSAVTTAPDELPSKPASKPRAPEYGASENGTE